MSAESEHVAADEPVPSETPVQMRVCPFCGMTRQPGSDRCDACTMDDTPLVRAATANKIGPWFVYQRRNPTAPGMKLAVLLNLIRAGHISAQTVVRGPTTQQLWAFARDVQGISRALGGCWSCHQPIAETDASCPRCRKSQDAPAEAELFVVSSERKPVMREVPAPRVPSNPTPIPISEAAAIVVPKPPEPTRVPKALQREAGSEGDAILSFEELATAFKLTTGKPRWSGWRVMGSFIKTIAAVLLIALLTLAAAFYVQPQWRYAAADRVRPHLTERGVKLPAWFERMPAIARATMPATTNPRSYDLTDTMGVPELPPEVAPATQRVSDPSTAVPEVVAPTTAKSPPEAAPVEVVPPTQVTSSPPIETTPPPAVQQANTPLALTPDLPTLDPKLSPLEKARQYRRLGIDAEAKRDFTLAQRLYEQIKLLPSDTHPADLELRLENAKRRAAAGR